MTEHDATQLRRRRRVLAALVCNAVVVAIEIPAAALAHSTALFADAGHNLGDVAGLALALVALNLALRAPTATRSYGYHRATILSALANMALLFVLTGLIFAGAVIRIVHPTQVDGATVAAVGLVALAANGIGALLLFERTPDLQVKSLLVHLGGDALASFGVIVAGAVIALSGRFDVLDPLVSLLIGALILFEGVAVARESVAVLLEGVPKDIDPQQLSAAIASVDGVESVHDLHCWSLSSDLRALSAHLVISGHPSLEQAQSIGGAVKEAISGPFRLAHTTLELECEPCAEEDEVVCTFGLVVVT